MPDVEADLTRRVASLERRLRIAILVAALGSASGVLATMGVVGNRANAATAAKPGSQDLNVLRVNELNVVDGNGVTRVKIGSPLPNAIVNGRQNRTRGGRAEDTMSGILLFDAEGVERSGCATVDRAIRMSC